MRPIYNAILICVSLRCKIKLGAKIKDMAGNILQNLQLVSLRQWTIIVQTEVFLIELHY